MKIGKLNGTHIVLTDISGEGTDCDGSNILAVIKLGEDINERLQSALNTIFDSEVSIVAHTYSEVNSEGYIRIQFECEYDIEIRHLTYIPTYEF